MAPHNFNVNFIHCFNKCASVGEWTVWISECTVQRLKKKSSLRFVCKGLKSLRLSSTSHTFYGNRRSSTMLTRTPHRSFIWAKSIHSTPYLHIYLRPILPLDLTSRLKSLVPSKLSFPFRVPNQIFTHISHLSHVWYMPRPFHSPENNIQ